MDRNYRPPPLTSGTKTSLSARRAWIEIFYYCDHDTDWIVALRKESVDRNTSIDNLTQGVFSRSPQGERG